MSKRLLQTATQSSTDLCRKYYSVTRLPSQPSWSCSTSCLPEQGVNCWNHLHPQPQSHMPPPLIFLLSHWLQKLCLYRLLHTLRWPPATALRALPIRLFSDSFMTFDFELHVCGLRLFLQFVSAFSVNHCSTSLPPPTESKRPSKICCSRVERGISCWTNWCQVLIAARVELSAPRAIHCFCRICFRKNSSVLLMTSTFISRFSQGVSTSSQGQIFPH